MLADESVVSLTPVIGVIELEAAGMHFPEMHRPGLTKRQDSPDGMTPVDIGWGAETVPDGTAQICKPRMEYIRHGM